jgi:hypothetical protein
MSVPLLRAFGGLQMHTSCHTILCLHELLYLPILILPNPNLLRCLLIQLRLAPRPALATHCGPDVLTLLQHQPTSGNGGKQAGEQGQAGVSSFA